MLIMFLFLLILLLLFDDVAAWFENLTTRDEAMGDANSEPEIIDCPAAGQQLREYNNHWYIPRGLPNGEVEYYCFVRGENLRQAWAKCFRCKPLYQLVMQRNDTLIMARNLLMLLAIVFAMLAYFYYEELRTLRINELIKKTDPPMMTQRTTATPVPLQTYRANEMIV